MNSSIRGLDPSQELRPDTLGRDIRPLLTQLTDPLRQPIMLAALIMGHAVVAWMFPAIGVFALLSAALLTAWGLTRKEAAPVKMPVQTKMIDVNEISPKTKQPVMAQGIFHLGNLLSRGPQSREAGKEFWLTNSDCRQHFLVVGTTGSGKTEALLGFCANALSWGSGFLFVDGKGDVSLYGKIYALARRFGREDDVLVMNFMTSNADVRAGGGTILSNTLNPFTTGSSDSLTQMVVSLMEEVGGDGAMWKGRATALFTGVMRALVWKREAGLIDLNIGVIRDHLNLQKIIALADEKGEQGNERPMPANIRASIEAYLSSLPGFQKEKGPKQSQTTLDQHGFLQMQFTKVLGSLADVYGHIFLSSHGEIDMTDVVLNRRILVVMLPALEKSTDEVANLGKIVVATLKGMMGSTLGSKIEGEWDRVIEARPYSSPSPFIVILDEVGYYCVDGMAIMAAQARGLGFSLVFATQDIPAMMRENDKEAKSIIANTTTKVFMRVEETEMTAKLAVESGGKGFRAQVSQFQGHSGEAHTGYFDNMEARIEQIDRISSLDLRALKVGEAIVTWMDKHFKVDTFHANPEAEYGKGLGKLKLRANHFIPVKRPDPKEIQQQTQLPKIAELLADPGFAMRMEADSKAARGKIEKAAREKRDPTTIRSHIPAAAVADVRANPKGAKGSPTDILTASCAAIAAVLIASKKQGDKFAQEVKRVDLGAVTARSGAKRLESEVPGLVDADAPPSRTAMPASALARDEHEFDDHAAAFAEAPIEQGAASFSDAVASIAGERDTDLAAPTRMRPVEHGVTVDHNMHKLAEKIQNNDSTLRLLAALNFDGEQSPEVTDQNLESAISSGEEGPSGPSHIPEQAEIDRADLASAKATQWSDRAAKPQPRQSQEPVQNLDDAVKSGDTESVTNAFLAELLLEPADK